MGAKMKSLFSAAVWVFGLSMFVLFSKGLVFGADLPEIKKAGVLRHLGVPYANFITGSGNGMDVEMMQLFAKHLGVKYQYVKTGWKDVIGDLTGKKVRVKGSDVEILDDVPVKGDVIANGFTILPWRQKVIDYSTPTFPTQVWLIARADFPEKPIKPTGDISKDIGMVKALLKGRTVLGKANTCLDPSLYGLKEVGARPSSFPGGVNDIAPAVIKGDAETCILDVPDALIALEKWPGKIKVIGPVSPRQKMGCGFARTSPLLREAFNRFLEQCKADGTYLQLIRKYYPAVFSYYPGFFEEK